MSETNMLDNLNCATQVHARACKEKIRIITRRNNDCSLH